MAHQGHAVDLVEDVVLVAAEEGPVEDAARDAVELVAVELVEICVVVAAVVAVAAAAAAAVAVEVVVDVDVEPVRAVQAVVDAVVARVDV